MRAVFLLVFVFFFCAPVVQAQEKKKRPFLSRLNTKHGIFLPIPLVVYSPETSFGFGVSPQYLYRLKNDSASNLSTVGATILYTLNKQFIFNPNWDFYIKENKYRVAGALLYQKFPENFYGIGNSTPRSNEESYTAEFLLLKNRFTYEIIKGLNLGFQYRLEYAFDFETEPGGLLSDTTIPGHDGYLASGVGLAAIYDTRDNALFPFSGAYITFSNHFYPKLLGSRTEFMNFKIDARGYFNPSKSHVIAVQGLFQFNVKEPPFRMMATMGGSEIMRGYYYGRFRDQHLMAGQVEYRFPIWWRFIGVAFFGVGDVMEQVKDIRPADFKYSWGAGLRFTLSAKERINLRFDVAFGNEWERGFYLQLSEAF